MRKRFLLKNISWSLIYQIIGLICGFITPRLILVYFSSDTNGLINSISQFLAVFNLMELGMSAVVQSALYKPIADKNESEISKIVTSAAKFFTGLAKVLATYIFVLALVYPLLVLDKFSYWDVFFLIVIIGFSSFCDYYFGIVDGIVLNAAQHGYVQFILRTVTTIANTVGCVVAVRLGAGIHVVKLVTSIVFLIRPFGQRIVVKKLFSIDRHVDYDKEPVQQKWNGVSQNIAAVVLDGTDQIVLTLFCSLAAVSIYSVYNLVLTGVKRLLQSLLNGPRHLLGDLLARKDDKFQIFFEQTECVFNILAVMIFGCTANLIVPFIGIYTAGITDTNYIVPGFAMVITMANAIYTAATPYHITIYAAGHYKETQIWFCLSAIINVVVSIVAVNRYGLVGVAIGTLIAMIFQWIWMFVYVYTRICNHQLRRIIPQLTANTISIVLSYLICTSVTREVNSYVEWFKMGVECFVIWAVITLISNCIFKYRTIKTLISMIRK